MTETKSPPPLSLVSHMDALPPGTRLAEFELVGLLGVGGFGMVYQAFDHSLQRLVAIKEYMPSALAGRSAGMTVSMRSAADAQTFLAGLKSFVSEARLLAQFDHPSLVRVFRFWEANNTAYMVMPLYSGITLKQARAQMRTPPPEAWLRKVLGSVLSALTVLHDSRTMHRDVSPDNIFLQDIGPPVLLDLGAARRAISDKSQKHTAILKVNYAPIEQYADAEDMRQGPWTDIYSLAAVVHGCVCNEAPMPATFRLLRDRMPSFESVAQTVRDQFGVVYSPEFIGAVTEGLTIRPEGRPQSVEAFSQLMGLHPQSLAKFDWRAELGDVWVPPGSAPEAAESVPLSADATEQRTLLMSTTVPGLPQAMAGMTQGRDLELPDWTGVSAYQTAPMPRASAVPAPAASSLSAAPVASEAATDLPLPLAEDHAVTAPEPPMPAGPPAPSASTAPAPATSASSTPADPAGSPAPARRGLVLALAGVVVAAGAAFWALRSPAPAADVPLAAASAPAAVASEAAAPASAALSGASSVAVAAAPAVAVAASAPASMAAPAAAASAPASAASGARPAASAPRKPASAPAVPASAAASRPVLEVRPAAPVEAAAPVRPPAPRPAAPSAPEPAKAVALCADASLLSRSMCMFRECQKPEYTNLPACVEQRRQLQNTPTQNSF